jgi:2-keto-4-pentenoate hydratase/2-oxohepta-3-ene-1,7-dioic acid hydratase in catechol pathway
MKKFKGLHSYLLNKRILSESDFVEPSMVDESNLITAHTQRYVKAILNGTLERKEERRMGLPWTQSLAVRSRLAVQGTLNAGLMALQDGIAGNLAGGTHHAMPDLGEGFCVFNDWSARDLQAWEYQPLGPFLAKNFASTVSPWIVTTEALAPYRTSWTRDENDPQPLDYLESSANRDQGSFDIQMDVKVQTQKMRDEGHTPTRISTSSFKHSYWTVAQMVTHHTVNGCNFMPGDMLGSGTQSGPTHEEAGSLLELSRGGKEKITLSNGEQRSFLEDGDNVVMRGWCEKEGFVRIGFGSVESTILPAK